MGHLAFWFSVLSKVSVFFKPHHRYVKVLTTSKELHNKDTRDANSVNWLALAGKPFIASLARDCRQTW
jgi:hypothetical protein